MRNSGRHSGRPGCRLRLVEHPLELAIVVIAQLVGDDRPEAGEEQQLALHSSQEGREGIRGGSQVLRRVASVRRPYGSSDAM